MGQSTDLQQVFIPPPDTSAELGYQLTVITRDGDPWFRSREVCGILGLVNVSQALSRLDPDEKVDHAITTNDTLVEVLVSESGMYALIFSSRRPEARAFRRWVTDEVLPQIRRTGSYGPGQLVRMPTSFPEALRELAAEVERREAAEIEARAAHEQRVEAVSRSVVLDRQLGAALGEVGQMQPKVEAYEAFLSQAGAYPLATAAQILGLGRQHLISQLGAWKVLIIRPGHSDHLRPYTEHVHAGRFVVKSQDVPIVHRDGTPEVITRGTTLVTPKGLDYIRGRQLRDGLIDARLRRPPTPGVVRVV